MKYEKFKAKQNIKIFADNRDELNTLEPQLADANQSELKLLCEVLGIDAANFNTAKLVSDYMIANKTESALKIFATEKSIKYPKYINDVISWCND